MPQGAETPCYRGIRVYLADSHLPALKQTRLELYSRILSGCSGRTTYFVLSRVMVLPYCPSVAAASIETVE